MLDELTELPDMAIYKEIASQAYYEAAQDKTDDPAARKLLKELVEEEVKHSEKLKALKESGLQKQKWHVDNISNLRMSKYLTGPDSLEGANFQDTIIFAIKREQEAIDFYSRMMSVLRDQTAKQLCKSLVSEELRHKLRLETFYDETIYTED